MTGLEMPKGAKEQNVVEAMRSLAGHKGEPLGEKKVEGVACTGFRSDVGGRKLVVWANKKTADPVRIEMTIAAGGGETTMVMTEIVLNEPLDDALFSLDPPADYKLDEREFEFPKLDNLEEEVAGLLRTYADNSGGAFPDSLFDWKALIDKTSKDGKVDEKLIGKIGAISGALFARPDSFGYTGAGVKRGEKDKIVFWYRPENSKTHRAVYGDLRIEDVAAHKLPATQPTKGPAK
jgi:hypothetical protein